MNSSRHSISSAVRWRMSLMIRRISSPTVALLRRYDDSGMRTLPLNPLLMQNAIIDSIVGEQGSAERRRCRQMIVIFPVNHVRPGGRQDIHIARPQSEYQRPSHGIFIQIQPDLAHW
jgi:hypothetical protein